MPEGQKSRQAGGSDEKEWSSIKSKGAIWKLSRMEREKVAKEHPDRILDSPEPRLRFCSHRFEKMHELNP